MKKPWIPSSFDLMHRHVRVVVDPLLPSRGQSGEAGYDACTIGLSSNLFDVRMTNPCNAAEVFWHEAWHHIMNVLGRHELAEDEQLSDQFGGLMAQMMATADWTPPEAE